MIDHLGFRVKDLAAARHFYEAIAKALGLSVIDNTATSFLVGRSAQEPIPFLWVGTDEPSFWTAENQTSLSPIHLAFDARDKEAVDAFHSAGLKGGGKDNGAPGPRGPEEWGYYAAYVLDPDGNNIEAGFRPKQP
jgi:catechol 2,3-dioxygenase-like lactoylglutathione lyase family enzyme